VSPIASLIFSYSRGANWHLTTGGLRKTVISHRYREAFDIEDFKLIEGLADFASIAVEQRSRQRNSQKPDNLSSQKIACYRAG
jgi:hypothetical protein